MTEIGPSVSEAVISADKKFVEQHVSDFVRTRIGGDPLENRMANAIYACGSLNLRSVDIVQTKFKIVHDPRLDFLYVPDVALRCEIQDDLDLQQTGFLGE